MRALVTGGAGFIGSNLADTLLDAGHDVRVIDDLSTGDERNISPGVELHRASFLDPAALDAAVAGVEVVFHLGALRAVSRSVDRPLDSDTVNVHGTLAVLDAAHRAGARRVVAASSSSVYGGSAVMPTPEDAPLVPRSPYAVTKLAGEHYCRVYDELHGLETVSMRYFNVFGPRQRPDSAYAAVIPLFIDALSNDRTATVHGDGEQTRDFTYVSDAVAGTIAASTAPADVCSGRAYNIAGGTSYSLLDVVRILGEILEVEPALEHTEARAGDVRHTRADPQAAERDLGFTCAVSFEAGLRRTVAAFSGT
jgi:UDP-glucose 4-epimerase